MDLGGVLLAVDGVLRALGAHGAPVPVQLKELESKKKLLLFFKQRLCANPMSNKWG